MSLLPQSFPPASGERRHWGPLPDASAALAIAEAAREAKRPLLLITRDSASAMRLQSELLFFAKPLRIELLPDWETLAYDNFSPHQDIISDRLRVLASLPDMKQGVLIAPVSTVLQRLAPAEWIQGNSFNLAVGDTLDLVAMQKRLTDAGYQRVDTVYEHGEFALRGAILDVFPMGSNEALRIDLIDDEIDSLRHFDTETQRTTTTIDAIEMLPAKEFPLDEAGISGFRRRWHERFDVDHRRCSVYQDVSEGITPAGIEYYLPLFFEHCSNLFDFLPADTLVMTEGPLQDVADHFLHEVDERYEQRRGDVQRPILPPKDLFLATDEMFAGLKAFAMIALHDEPLPKAASHDLFGAGKGPEPGIDARADDPLQNLRRFCESHRSVLICAESAGRREALFDLFRKHHFDCEGIADWNSFIDGPDTIAITVAPLERGLLWQQPDFAVISESQLFGRRVSQSRRRQKSTQDSDMAVRNLAELQPGAAVVHIDHGVGRYLGLQSLEIDGQSNEFLTLLYAEEAKLYVPVADLHLISRYSGSDEDHAPMHRLGNEQWAKAKRKAAEKVRDVAAELLEIYAQREARQGHALSLDEDDYQRFASTFPFEETADQEQAIAAVLSDMQAPQPMDRLICGDVGFGKTEVAMRAAFVAIQNQKQVVVLVPTTLLAQQHFESFRDRFADWPVNVDVISRFRSAAEQKGIIDQVEQGKVDILIGTHKLLGGSMKWQDLGLVIIDEEHRFGVRQKEALKALRAEVDILTLTATPIPRTLNMSMSGMRDLSIIATPPARRLSVKTFVRERDSGLIREAIMREILRGGQVYYLHNEVKSIEKAARELREMMPELRVGIGHGQMPERELEQVMSDFYHRRHNVLMCSTIIETGIDVPNANTIIIERADKFGLAQLHQLRGRVGRSHHQAYAYLLTPPSRQMTTDAHKRLEAISAAQDLGAGFTLATHDLEIRGAGELLGDEQSGQIESIGFTLYMDMLDRAVKALKSGKALDIEHPLEEPCEVNLRVPALIPDDYLPDVQARLVLYKRIANAPDEQALHELQVEMIDRFGLLPDPVKNLFRVSQIKLTAASLGIAKLEASAGGLRLEFAEETSIDPLTLVQLVQSKPAQYRLDGASALRGIADLEQRDARFEALESLLNTLKPSDRAE